MARTNVALGVVDFLKASKMLMPEKIVIRKQYLNIKKRILSV